MPENDKQGSETAALPNFQECALAAHPLAVDECVTVPIVDVVNVVAVRNSHVAAAWTVLVLVSLVSLLLLGLALHPLAIELAVNVTIVDIVRVVPVGNGNVTAPRAVLVLVICVNFVLRQRHGCPPSSIGCAHWNPYSLIDCQ